MQNLLDDTQPQPVLASKRSRIAAAIIDGIINIGLIYLVVGILMGDKESFYSNSENGISIGFNLSGVPALVALAIWFVQFPIMEGLTKQTVGKMVMGLKVVRQDFQPASFAQSLIRHLLDIIDLILFIGLIVAASNTKKQRIGDLVAQTVVVAK